MIPYGRQDVTSADIDAAVAVLRSDWLTQGPAVPKFEAAIAAYCGSPHAVAANSATSALHLACLALGLGPGDRLWTSPITFVASANCALYCGATVEFVDVDGETANISVPELERNLHAARRDGTLPKIVIPVHFAGEPCDMERIGALAQEFGFHVIEDAAHAIGARYRDEPVGNCKYSDITVFSFHPVKIITTGEGGAAVCRDVALAERMALLRSHGITRNPSQMNAPAEGPWYYEQFALGFNYRMNDIQAELGTSQLSRIESSVERRHYLAARYDSLLADLPVEPLRRDQRNRSALHLYPIRLRLEQLSRDRLEVVTTMRERGIGVNVHYIPVHTQPYFRTKGFAGAAFPAAERYYERTVSLPLFPGLDDAAQNQVISVLREVLAA